MGKEELEVRRIIHRERAKKSRQKKRAGEAERKTLREKAQEAEDERLLLKKESQQKQQDLWAAQAQVAALQARAQAEERQRNHEHIRQHEQERKRVADFCRLQAALASKDRHIRVLTRNCDKYELQTQELRAHVSLLSDTRGGPEQALSGMGVKVIAAQEHAVWEHIEQMAPELRPLIFSFEQIQQPGFEVELGKGRDVVIYGPTREVLVWYQGSFQIQLMENEGVMGAGSSQMQSRDLSHSVSGSAPGASGSSMSSLGSSQHQMKLQEGIQGQSKSVVSHDGHNSMDSNERSEVEDSLMKDESQAKTDGMAPQVCGSEDIDKNKKGKGRMALNAQEDSLDEAEKVCQYPDQSNLEAKSEITIFQA